MAINSEVHTLSTTPQLIADGYNSSVGDMASVLLTEASATIYVGGSAVDSTDGTAIAVDEAFSIDLSAGDSLYAVAASGTPTVKVLTTRTAYVEAS